MGLTVDKAQFKSELMNSKRSQQKISKAQILKTEQEKQNKPDETCEVSSVPHTCNWCPRKRDRERVGEKQ